MVKFPEENSTSKNISTQVWIETALDVFRGIDTT